MSLLSGKKYFTSLDLKNGYFHIKMHPDSIKLTAFVTPIGQFEFLQMPFRLKGAPSRFMRWIARIFKELTDAGDVIIYMDDMLIATRTIDEHLRILDKAFKLLVDNCLELRIDKCKFIQTEIEYLGYLVKDDGIWPTSQGTRAVQEFPVSRNMHDVQGFVSLCSYFRKFIEGFSITAKPLYDLCKKNVMFQFKEKEMIAFETLKRKLVDAPVLAIYSPYDETELHTDASALGFAAILMQKKADRKFHPVFYFSKRTSDSESRYHSFELETLAIVYALRRFRVYLHGIKFKIVTDCQAFTLTLNKKEILPKIARWALELQDFEYELEHRSNSKMTHVDALSRRYSIIILEDNTFERNLAISQSTDSEIVKIRAKLENSEDKLYEMRNGIVYRKKDKQILFYVPEQLESQVIRKYYDKLGHVGSEKTLDNIVHTYWFSNMHRKIKQHIESCLKCIAFSPVSGKSEGLLHTIPKGEIPFATLHIDHLGPMTKIHSAKKRYIFRVIDGFTKFIKLFATKTTNTAEVIGCLTTYFKHYSRPTQIISDRGSSFTSKEFERFMQANNIQHVKIATASSQANGQIERMNRFIVPMIAKLAAERNQQWYDVLTDVEFACNNTISRTTGQTPSMLLFGVRQRGNAIDSLKDYIESEQVVTRDLPNMRKDANRRIEQVQVENEKYYNRRHKNARKYDVGDKVMIRNFVTQPGVTTKLIPRYKGPYEVIKVLRNDRYILSDIEGFQISQTPYKGTWHVSNMKPWLK